MERKIRKLGIIYLIFIIGNACFAQPIDTNVAYTNGTFITTVTTSANTSWENVDRVTEKFISQYKTDLNALFDWALTGVELQGEKDKFMTLHIKSHQLEGDIVQGQMDIAIPMLGRTYTGVTYNVSLTKTNAPNETEISYHLYDCEEVIESVNATVKIVHTDDEKAIFTLVAEVKLKKFYDRIVTKNMYSKNMNRRFIRFVENLVNEAKL